MLTFSVIRIPVFVLYHIIDYMIINGEYYYVSINKVTRNDKQMYSVRTQCISNERISHDVSIMISKTTWWIDVEICSKFIQIYSRLNDSHC